MKFSSPLIPGKIIQRYKRFLADVELTDGTLTTVHTPNTGSMLTCWEKNWPVMLSQAPNAQRKYPFTLEMTHNGRSWIGINTHLANSLVEEALKLQQIPELARFSHIQREKKVGESRLDFFLQENAEDTKLETSCFVEVKNVTLWGEGDFCYFPDAKSERGLKHLRLLRDLAKQGHRSVIFFIVQRQDVHTFAPAFHLDPLYARSLQEVHQEGVEILVYQWKVSPQEISLEQKLPFNLDQPTNNSFLKKSR